MPIVDLQIPISEDAIRSLHIGDQVRLYGTVVTARDAAHKYIMDTFIHPPTIPESEQALHDELRRLWSDGVIYHCGPVVSQDESGRWRFVAAGPTTSIREEPYEADVIAHFGVRAVIGKGGMGPKTLAACQKYGAVYLHAVGGAATLIASSVKEVLTVYKKDELGVPEAFWVVRVEGFPAVITMDAHGQSLHETMAATSAQKLADLIGTRLTRRRVSGRAGRGRMRESRPTPVPPFSHSHLLPFSIQSRQLIRVAAMVALDLLHTSSQAAQEVKRRGLVLILDDHFQLDDLFGREGDRDFLRFGQCSGSLLTSLI